VKLEQEKALPAGWKGPLYTCSTCNAQNAVKFNHAVIWRLEIGAGNAYYLCKDHLGALSLLCLDALDLRPDGMT
jgi:hypothetical protein